MKAYSYDEVFRSKIQASEALQAEEALMSFGVLAMTVDGDVSHTELYDLDSYASDLGISTARRKEIHRKITRVLREDGPGALFNAAMRSIPPNQLESAFELAVRVVLSDNEVQAVESDYLVELSQSMGIADSRAREIMDAVLGLG